MSLSEELNEIISEHTEKLAQASSREELIKILENSIKKAAAHFIGGDDQPLFQVSEEGSLSVAAQNRSAVEVINFMLKLDRISKRNPDLPSPEIDQMLDALKDIVGNTPTES